MDPVREVWFSTRRLIVFHIYPNCGATGNAEPRNKSTTWVEIDEDGYPIDLPETARLCTVCEEMVPIRKSEDPHMDEETFRYLV